MTLPRLHLAVHQASAEKSAWRARTVRLHDRWPSGLQQVDADSAEAGGKAETESAEVRGEADRHKLWRDTGAF